MTETARCESVAERACLDVGLPRSEDAAWIADLVSCERAHAMATALFIERVAIWLSRIAELGAALAYQAEVRRLRDLHSPNRGVW